MPKSKTSERKKSKPNYEAGSDNIFVDLGFHKEQAIKMLARANLMGVIRSIIQENHWTQSYAAKVLKISQPRVAEIMGMKTQHYSVDLLLKLLNRLDKQVLFTVTDQVSEHELLAKQLGAEIAAIALNKKALKTYEVVTRDFDNTVADGL
jgi:predicted XRE-type DNA-binding protein